MIVSTPFIPVPPPTYGGLERVVFDLAAGLRELRLDVAVACPSESKLPRGVEHINIGPSKYSVQQNWVEAEKEAYDHYQRSTLGSPIISGDTSSDSSCSFRNKALDAFLSYDAKTRCGHAPNTPSPSSLGKSSVYS